MIVFQFEKYKVQDRFERKGELSEAIKKLERYNLIEMNGKLGEADTKIKIFPSIQFALDANEFHLFAEQAEKRMFTKDLQSRDIDLENEDGEGFDDTDE